MARIALPSPFRDPLAIAPRVYVRLSHSAHALCLPLRFLSLSSLLFFFSIYLSRSLYIELVARSRPSLTAPRTLDHFTSAHLLRALRFLSLSLSFVFFARLHPLHEQGRLISSEGSIVSVSLNSKLILFSVYVGLWRLVERRWIPIWLTELSLRLYSFLYMIQL